MIVKIGREWLSNDLCLCGVCSKSKDCETAKLLRQVCNCEIGNFKSHCEHADTQYQTFHCVCGDNSSFKRR